MSGHNNTTKQQTASVNLMSLDIEDIKTKIMRNQLDESDILLLYNQYQQNDEIQSLLRPHLDRHIMHV